MDGRKLVGVGTGASREEAIEALYARLVWLQEVR